MKNHRLPIILYTFVLLCLVGCTASTPEPTPTAQIPTIQLTEIPVHPQAIHNTDPGPRASLPWNVADKVISDGPYQGYSVEGPEAYIFKMDGLDPSIEAFYQTSLTEAGWQPGETTAYILGIGQAANGQAWTKGRQVIYLITFASPFQANSGWLNVYLLTQ